MKTLKLNHDSAQLISEGRANFTWRIFDDKQLSVNDEVQLLDKVDPGNRETWVPIGVGVIESVTEKRIREISESEKQAYENVYGKIDDVIELFAKLYGKEITDQDVIKIVTFSFSPISKSAINVDKKTTNEQLPKEIKMYADGGSRGNPGPSASGYVLYDMSGEIVAREGIYIGVTTNNQAEYLAVKYGLTAASKGSARAVHVYLDSLLVVNQMIGKFKVKNRDLWPIHSAIKDIVATFEHVEFTHVPRALNKEADAAVNEALDAHAESMA
jgi:ribonuclease HI